MADPFLRNYDKKERETAAEFLTHWIPFISQDMCDDCCGALRRRVLSIRSGPSEPSKQIEPTGQHQAPEPSDNTTHISSAGWGQVTESRYPAIHLTPSGWDPDHQTWNKTTDFAPSGWDPVPEPSTPIIPTRLDLNQAPESSRARMSWADMAQEEDELEEDEDEGRLRRVIEARGETGKKKMLSREQKELIRFRNVKRNKEFVCLERISGRIVNIAEGLELHTGVFSPIEQKRIVDYVYEVQERGRKGELGERTYSAPNKWMRGKGRVTIQFGCNYNYATDRNGNPPGILRNVAADPMPQLFKTIIKRLIKWQILPTTCVPDSCIVNIYESGDCIPPHIDSHNFVRPFCTISFLSECSILFGTNLKIMGPGEFSGSFSIPLPVGSVLVLNGNGADVAKHCVPAVPNKRISITFRKMDKPKWPAGFCLEPDLQNVVPLQYDSDSNMASDEKGKQPELQSSNESRNLNLNSNSNSSWNARAGRRSRGKAPIIRTLYRSPLLASTSNHLDASSESTELERCNSDDRGGEGMPNSQRRVPLDLSVKPSSTNEVMESVSIGGSGSEHSQDPHPRGWSRSLNNRRRTV